MLAAILTLFVIVTAVFTYAMWQAQLERTYEIDLIIHKYLVEMETTDFSSQAAISSIYSQLRTELEEHHITNISFAGSTQNPVETGRKITLHVTGEIDLSHVEMPTGGGIAGAVLGKETHVLDLVKSGTAMY